MPNCIICNQDANPGLQSTMRYWSCPRCGKFEFRKITDQGVNLENQISSLSLHKKASLSSIVRRGQARDEYFAIKEDILKNLTFIVPNEQAEYLISYLGEYQKVKGNKYRLIPDDERLKLYAFIGMPIDDGTENFNYICANLLDEGLLETLDINSNGRLKNGLYQRIRLTFSGWKKYQELLDQTTESMFGFMAMKFPKKGETEELEIMYDILKEEIKENTKFMLDNPCLEREKAGSITNRIAVEIKRARFVVADLTHDNSGAYWEAGLANGLGKPVFYICKKGITTHFDTNQHTTIEWEPGEEKQAAERLRYAILNTLPEGDKG